MPSPRPSPGPGSKMKLLNKDYVNTMYHYSFDDPLNRILIKKIYLWYIICVFLFPHPWCGPSWPAFQPKMSNLRTQLVEGEWWVEVEPRSTISTHTCSRIAGVWEYGHINVKTSECYLWHLYLVDYLRNRWRQHFRKKAKSEGPRCGWTYLGRLATWF